MMALQWIEDEFSTLDLNDKRRERRAKIIVQQLSSMANSTPDACRDNAAPRSNVSNKKGQGPPGSTTLWRGLRKLEAYRDAYIAFGNT